MLLVLLQLDFLVQLVEVPVHPGPDVAGALGVLEDLGVLALLAPDDGGHHLDAGALRQGEDLVDDLVDGLLFDLLAALGAVGSAHPGPEKPEIVVDLRHRAHSGPGVLAGGFLVNGDGGAQALDIVHIGLVHLAQEHPGVGAQGLHIPPLALGVNRIKGQGALAGAGEARHHHQLVPGDGDVDILQIVGAGAFDDDLILHDVYDLLLSGEVIFWMGPSHWTGNDSHDDGWAMHPPFSFRSCRKENGPCTVQKKRTLLVALRHLRASALYGS